MKLLTLVLVCLLTGGGTYAGVAYALRPHPIAEQAAECAGFPASVSRTLGRAYAHERYVALVDLPIHYETTQVTLYPLAKVCHTQVFGAIPDAPVETSFNIEHAVALLDNSNVHKGTRVMYVLIGVVGDSPYPMFYALKVTLPPGDGPIRAV